MVLWVERSPVIDLQEKKKGRSLISILWQPFKRKVNVMKFHCLHEYSVDCSVVSSSDPPAGYVAACARRVPHTRTIECQVQENKISCTSWKIKKNVLEQKKKKQKPTPNTSIIYIIWDERLNTDLLKTKIYGISYFFLCFKFASLQPYVVCPVKVHVCYFSQHVFFTLWDVPACDGIIKKGCRQTPATEQQGALLINNSAKADSFGTAVSFTVDYCQCVLIVLGTNSTTTTLSFQFPSSLNKT